MKHTPGPWYVAPQEDSPYEPLTVASEVAGSIVTLWLDDAPCEDFNRRQRANAKLISLAPDMAEVLLAVQRSYCLEIGSDRETPGMRKARTLVGRLIDLLEETK